MHHRVAFYGGCARDVAGAGALLEPFADEIVFCDRRSELEKSWRAIEARASHHARWRFVIGDLKEVLAGLDQVSVVLQRRDSHEGGTGLSIFREPLFRLLASKLPDRGGLLISDGSCTWPRDFRRITRPVGTLRSGWRLRPAGDQPLLEVHGLWIVEAKQEMEKPYVVTVSGKGPGLQ
jgi:hypothetical protein